MNPKREMRKIETKLKLGKALHFMVTRDFSVHFNKVFKSFKSVEIALKVQSGRPVRTCNNNASKRGRKSALYSQCGS